jgi:hypothetical protein
MSPNAADRKSVRQQEKAARLADRQRQEVITSIMSTAPGRAWLWDTLASCHIFVTTFIPDSNASAFQEGRRSVGLALLADIMQACPDYYIQAMRESNERHITQSIRDSSVSTSDDPASERSSSPLADGGDLGAESDPGDTEVRDPDYSSFGSDIYAPGGKTQ